MTADIFTTKKQAKEEMHRRIDEHFEEMFEVYETISNQIKDFGEKMREAEKIGDTGKSDLYRTKMINLRADAWLTSDVNFSLQQDVRVLKEQISIETKNILDH